MSALSLWSMRLCALASVCALVRIVMPDLHRRGLFPLLRAVLLLTALTSLLPAVRGALDELHAAPVNLTAAAFPTQEDAWAEGVRASLSAALAEKLSEDGINMRDIRIDCTVGEQSVKIDRIILVLSEEMPGLAEELTAEWDVPVIVTAEGG